MKNTILADRINPLIYTFFIFGNYSGIYNNYGDSYYKKDKFNPKYYSICYLQGQV